MGVSSKSRLSEVVALHIASEIVSGRLLPGDTIPAEIELVNDRDVSKAVVREAIQVLSAVGLITVRHGKRALVRDGGDWNILHPLVQDAYVQQGRGKEVAEQLYDVRWALECFVAQAAAEKISDHDLARLLELAGGMNQVHERQVEIRSFLDMDKEFHFILARASGNLPAFTILKSLSSSSLGDWWKKVSPDDLPLLAGQHSRIASAVASRDARLAMKMMDEHLRAGRSVHIVQTEM